MNPAEQKKVEALSPRLKDFYRQGYDLARSGGASKHQAPPRKDELEAFNLGMYHGTLSVQDECSKKD